MVDERSVTCVRLKAQSLHRCTDINNPPVILLCCEQVVKCLESLTGVKAVSLFCQLSYFPAINQKSALNVPCCSVGGTHLELQGSSSLQVSLNLCHRVSHKSTILGSCDTRMRHNLMGLQWILMTVTGLLTVGCYISKAACAHGQDCCCQELSCQLQFSIMPQPHETGLLQRCPLPTSACLFRRLRGITAH